MRDVALGSEHAIFFAEQFPRLTWQPTDLHPEAIASITAWREAADLPNVLEPLTLDASASSWPVQHADALLSINMVHISPWASALGLLDGAARILPAGCPLILYGPWITTEAETAPSNLDFDRDLRARDPEWGLRSVEDFAAAASDRGLKLDQTRAMPANNRALLLRRT